VDRFASKVARRNSKIYCIEGIESPSPPNWVGIGNNKKREF